MSEFNSVPLRLSSVGCGIDGRGMVYPMLGWNVKTGLTSYDIDNGVHISDIEPDSDWTLALSDEDRNRIDELRVHYRRGDDDAGT
tara:strand:+ start:203 stop:457 length:255 start_codon:yes stop_codon:yes gene_type:complete